MMIVAALDGFILARIIRSNDPFTPICICTYNEGRLLGETNKNQLNKLHLIASISGSRSSISESVSSPLDWPEEDVGFSVLADRVRFTGSSSEGTSSTNCI